MDETFKTSKHKLEAIRDLKRLLKRMLSPDEHGDS